MAVSAADVECWTGLDMSSVHDAITVMHETRNGGRQTADVMERGRWRSAGHVEKAAERRGRDHGR